MKKNMIALAVLLVLVAVAAQFTRQGGKKSEWVALEHDMQASLEALWQQPGQKAELMPAQGGPTAVVTVRMPPQAKGSWNFAFLDFVAARHPAVQLKGMDIRDGLSGNPIAAEAASPTENSLSVAQPDLADSGRRAELLRRQAQAVVDQQVGAGQGLVLLEVREIAAPVSVESNSGRPNNPGSAHSFEAPPESQGKSARVRRRVEEAEGMREVEAPPSRTPQFQVLACLVFAA